MTGLQFGARGFRDSFAKIFKPGDCWSRPDFSRGPPTPAEDVRGRAGRGECDVLPPIELNLFGRQGDPAPRFELVLEFDTDWCQTARNLAGGD